MASSSSSQHVPELASLSPEERKRITRLHQFAFFKDRRYWISLVGFMIVLGVCTGALTIVRQKFFPDLSVLSSTILFAVACGILGCLYGIIVSQIQQSAMRPYIRKELGLPELNNAEE